MLSPLVIRNAIDLGGSRAGPVPGQQLGAEERRHGRARPAVGPAFKQHHVSLAGAGVAAGVGPGRRVAEKISRLAAQLQKMGCDVGIDHGAGHGDLGARAISRVAIFGNAHGRLGGDAILPKAGQFERQIGRLVEKFFILRTAKIFDRIALETKESQIVQVAARRQAARMKCRVQE